MASRRALRRSCGIVDSTDPPDVNGALAGEPAIARFRAFVCPLGAVAQLGERLVRNEEVRGSIPLGSTSLRRFAATTGKPAFSRIEMCI